MAESLSRLWTEAMQRDERYVDLKVMKGKKKEKGKRRGKKGGRDGGRGLSRLWTDTLQRRNKRGIKCSQDTIAKIEMHNFTNKGVLVSSVLQKRNRGLSRLRTDTLC